MYENFPLLPTVSKSRPLKSIQDSKLIIRHFEHSPIGLTKPPHALQMAFCRPIIAPLLKHQLIPVETHCSDDIYNLNAPSQAPRMHIRPVS